MSKLSNVSKAIAGGIAAGVAVLLPTLFPDQLADGSLSLGEILTWVGALVGGGFVVYKAPKNTEK